MEMECLSLSSDLVTEVVRLQFLNLEFGLVKLDEELTIPHEQLVVLFIDLLDFLIIADLLELL